MLEYELPGTSQRVDAPLLGRRPHTEIVATVVVELKPRTRWCCPGA
ncbi:hypothetical protein ACFYOY_01950 [Streptomyces sp. NPDC007875]